MKPSNAMRFLHMGCGESLQASRAARGVAPEKARPGENRRTQTQQGKGGKRHEGRH